MILSRFPIVSQEHHRFSLGLHADSEATYGVLHARIQITEDSYLQVFNLHDQTTNFYSEPEQAEYSRMVRNLAFRELRNLLKLKLTS